MTKSKKAERKAATRETEQNRQAGEMVREAVDAPAFDPWRWSTPCSSPEPPVSHSWRLFDSYPREIWYGGIVLLHAYCITCGGLAKFSEGAWETTVALGDGPCVAWS